MRKLLAVCMVLAAGLSATGQAPNDPATREDVLKMMELNGTKNNILLFWENMAKNMGDTFANAYKQQNPNATPEQIANASREGVAALEKVLKGMPVDELIDVTIPVYQRHLTHQDVTDINAFYSSPAGQKLLKETPELMAETMQAASGVVKKHQAEMTAAFSAAIREVQEEEKSKSNGTTGSSPIPPRPGTGNAEYVQVSQGISEGLILSKVDPVYPALARQARIQGTVVLGAVIGTDGTVLSLHVVSGHPMLAPAAMDAVKQWKYKPYTLNGKAIEVQTTINVNFMLAAPSPAGSSQSH